MNEKPADRRAELDEALELDELEPIKPEEPREEPREESRADPSPQAPAEEELDPEREPDPDPVPPEEPEVEAFKPMKEEPAEARPKRRRRLSLLGFLRSETTRRVLWALPWVLFAIIVVVVGDVLFAAALVALGILGLREFFTMTARAAPFPLPAYLTLAGMVIAAHFGSSFQVLLAAACGFPLIFLFAARRGSLDNITYSIAITVLGVSWLGLGFSHAVLLRDLPLHGGALVIDVLVATFVGDTAAYAAGRMFGSRKLAPRISPNKTLEGLIGGFLGATLGLWCAGLYQDWLSGNEALVMGMVVGVLAAAGDLFASMIKRDCDVKDTGSLFGPHGGLIDRLDAVLFTIVAGYYLSVAFVY
ncbi:MAG: phosphatidate cytidylyltransferase [Solirubrobacterales bacterium]